MAGVLGRAIHTLVGSRQLMGRGPGRKAWRVKDAPLKTMQKVATGEGKLVLQSHLVIL